MKLTKALLLLLVVAGCAHLSISEYDLGREHARQAVELPSWKDAMEASYRYLFEDQTNQVPAISIPVKSLTRQVLDDLPNDKISAIRFGHSTVLIKLNGRYWLTDPVFSQRLGPIYPLGIERFHRVPIGIEDLPEIHGVLISHNHYDHLDKRTVKALHHKVNHFFTPLGNGELLVDWGVDPAKIKELDWWEDIQLDGFRISATPANHLSGRMLIDQNEALWSSWVLQHQGQRIFFSGDTGYTSVFKEIGDRYGPFDLTLMENGSYDRCWAKEHLTPAETVQAHLDLKGKVLMPVHNSTFDLAFHEWNEPLKKVSEIAKEKDVALAVPQFGQPFVAIGRAISLVESEQNYWWR